MARAPARPRAFATEAPRASSLPTNSAADKRPLFELMLLTPRGLTSVGIDSHLTAKAVNTGGRGRSKRLMTYPKLRHFIIQ